MHNLLARALQSHFKGTLSHRRWQGAAVLLAPPPEEPVREVVVTERLPPTDAEDL